MAAGWRGKLTCPLCCEDVHLLFLILSSGPLWPLKRSCLSVRHPPDRSCWDLSQCNWWSGSLLGVYCVPFLLYSLTLVLARAASPHGLSCLLHAPQALVVHPAAQRLLDHGVKFPSHRDPWEAHWPSSLFLTLLPLGVSDSVWIPSLFHSRGPISSHLFFLSITTMVYHHVDFSVLLQFYCCRGSLKGDVFPEPQKRLEFRLPLCFWVSLLISLDMNLEICPISCSRFLYLMASS